MEQNRKELPKATLDDQKRICEVRAGISYVVFEGSAHFSFCLCWDVMNCVVLVFQMAAYFGSGCVVRTVCNILVFQMAAYFGSGCFVSVLYRL
jgi:hypothetical protein